MIVKHTGFEVTPDSELNGFTFNAVGSGTVSRTYRPTALRRRLRVLRRRRERTNAIALYVRDDSLDYSDGYAGTITNALVIHYQTNGNRCIEATTSVRARSDVGVPLDTAPLTTPTIRNMTCITGNTDVNTHGDSEGALARQGGHLLLENSIVYSGYGSTTNGTTANECYEIESTESLAAAGDGEATFVASNNVVACEEAIKGVLANGDELTEWFLGANPSTNGADYSFNAGNFVIADATNANTQVLLPGTFYTAPAIVDAAARRSCRMRPASAPCTRATTGRPRGRSASIRPTPTSRCGSCPDPSGRLPMNKLTLREAVRRVLLGMSAAAAGSMFQPVALAQEQAPTGAQPAAPRQPWRK